MSPKDIRQVLVEVLQTQGEDELKTGTLVTPEVVNRLKNSKIDKVLVGHLSECQHEMNLRKVL